MTGKRAGETYNTIVIAVANNGGCVVWSLTFYEVDATVLAGMKRHNIVGNRRTVRKCTDSFGPNKRTSLRVLVNSAISEREHFTRSITGTCQRWISSSTAYPTETHLRFSRRESSAKVRMASPQPHPTTWHSLTRKPPR